MTAPAAVRLPAHAGVRDFRHTAAMPFPGEPFGDQVRVVPYQDHWAEEGADLVARLELLLPEAPAVDNIGSTSVPGLPAKDCIDAMVRVRSLNDTDLDALLAEGFRDDPSTGTTKRCSARPSTPSVSSHRHREAGP
jgi:GrpB-like predicted nucleotidyltransferase (UPF0157 family)